MDIAIVLLLIFFSGGRGDSTSAAHSRFHLIYMTIDGIPMVISNLWYEGEKWKCKQTAIDG